jgi:hypothetical protein
MANPTNTTELEAVNRMLSTIGIARVTSITNTAADAREDIQEALAILGEVTREVQKEGWEFNTDREWSLTPTANKFPVPVNAMQVTFPRRLYPSGKGPGPRFTVRDDAGTRTVWDKDAHTFTITDLTEIKVDIVRSHEFIDLPEAARWYILIRAARQFANVMLSGQETIRGFTERDELQALAALKEAEGEVADYSIFDSYDMAFILDREGGF